MSSKIYSVLIEQNPEIGEELKRQVQGILSTPEFQTIRKSEQEYANSIAPKLEKAGWWLTPSTPLTLWLRLKGLNKTIINSREIERLFIETFEENNWNSLSNIVNNWFDNKVFTQRSQIILDALDAHKLEKYTLSIPAILPQVEGILSSVTGKLAGKLVRLLKESLPNEKEELLNNVSEGMLLGLATSPYMFHGIEQSYFSSDRFPEWLDKRGISGENILNRDAILHGIQLNYASKANSLKAFLLLDSLHPLVTMKKPS